MVASRASAKGSRRRPPEFSAKYSWVRSLELEGSFPRDVGVWATSGARISAGWGLLREKDWPLPPDATWPFDVPAALDAKAKPYRVAAYQRVRTVDECAFAVTKLNPVVVAVRATNRWFDAPDGVIPMRSKADRDVGAHAVLVVGYSNEQFIFANSWGTDWGAQGFGRMPFDYFASELMDAYISHPYALHRDGNNEILNWGIADPIAPLYGQQTALHVAEIIDGRTHDRRGWSFAVERDGLLDVEELFVRPDARRRGYASTMLGDMLGLAKRLGRRLRLLVPHADANDDHRRIIARLARARGLQYVALSERWCEHAFEQPSLAFASLGWPAPIRRR